MPRLIDADKIEIRYEYGMHDNGLAFVPLRDVHKSIAATPTVDAVEVVRCQNCVNAFELDGRAKHLITVGAKRCQLGRGADVYGESVVLGHQFCDEGERRDDHEE